MAPAHSVVTSIGAAAGPALPLGSLGAHVEAGYTASVALGAQPASSSVGFRFEALYDEYQRKQSASLKRRVVGGIANAVWTLPANIGDLGDLYVVGGLGLFGSYDTNTTDGNSGATNANTGLNLGLGYRLPLTGFSTRLEVGARFAGGGTVIPVTFGVVF